MLRHAAATSRPGTGQWKTVVRIKGVDVVAEGRGSRVAAGPLIACAAGLCVATTYYYVGFSRLIDQRLHGERDRVLRACSRGRLEIRRGPVD